MRISNWPSSLFLPSIGIVLACAASAGWAAEQNGSGAREHRYQQERQVCLDGRSNQDRATCLQEAYAARAEPAGRLVTLDPQTYQNNAIRRCDRHEGADREDCLARMKGEGTRSGSADGGGIFRELVR